MARRRRRSSDPGIAILAVILVGLVAVFIKLYKKSPVAALTVLVAVIGFIALISSISETPTTMSPSSTYTRPAFTTPTLSPSPLPSSTLPSNSSEVGNRKQSGATGGTGGDDYYTNVDGESVRRPVRSKTAPAGATAQCIDGTYSFSRHARGACSHHGGVARWL